jgi:hypothetical protein
LQVDLAYRFVAGRSVGYRWSVDSTTTVEGQARSARKVSFVADVAERVIRAQGRRAQLSILITPRRVLFDGAAAPAGRPVLLRLEIDELGRVKKIDEAGDLSPGLSESLELGRLLAESRPLLPPSGVWIADTWPAGLTAKGPKSSIDLEGKGILEGFAVEGGRRVARISISRSGKVASRERVGGALVDLEGTAASKAGAKFDVDAGYLLSSVTRSESDFDIQSGPGVSTGRVKVVLTARVSVI